MAKGIFTQGVVVLTNGQPTINELRLALNGHGIEVVKQTPDVGRWALGGPTLLVPFRPEVNGYTAIDLVDRPWPDAMGDPKTDLDTFGAWSMGYFGPFAFPGGLARARQHAWAWEPGATIADGHQGFVRIRTSYVFGAEGELLLVPGDYDPLAELTFVSQIVLALLEAPGTVCYFNPNGEVLRDLASFRDMWDACLEQPNVPLPLWMNIRFFNLTAKLGFMDTVGNGQLDISDIEAIFPKSKYDPGDVDYYLRNVTHYLNDSDREIKAGDDIDGPGANELSWTIDVLEEGLVNPPRPVLRLYPKASRAEVHAALVEAGGPSA